MQSLNHRSVLPNGVRQSHNLRACLRSWFLCFSVSIFGVSPPLDPFSERKFSLTFFECRESVWGQFSSCFFAGDFHHSFHGKWEALWLEAGSSLWHQCVIQTRKVSPKASPKNSPESDHELDRSQSHGVHEAAHGSQENSWPRNGDSWGLTVGFCTTFSDCGFCLEKFGWPVTSVEIVKKLQWEVWITRRSNLLVALPATV